MIEIEYAYAGHAALARTLGAWFRAPALPGVVLRLLELPVPPELEAGAGTVSALPVARVVRWGRP